MEKTKIKFHGGVEHLRQILGKCQNLARKHQDHLHPNFQTQIWAQHEQNLNHKLNELADLQSLKNTTGEQNKENNLKAMKFVGQLRDLIVGNLGRDQSTYPTEIIPFMSGRVDSPQEYLKILWGYTQSHPQEIPTGSKVQSTAISALLENAASGVDPTPENLENEIFQTECSLHALMNEIYDDAGQMVSFARGIWEAGDPRLAEFEEVRAVNG